MNKNKIFNKKGMNNSKLLNCLLIVFFTISFSHAQTKMFIDLKSNNHFEYRVDSIERIIFPSDATQKQMVVQMKNQRIIPFIRSEISKIYFGDKSIDNQIIKKESNCYIISPGSSMIKIPVSRANTALQGSIGSNDQLEAVLIWTDNPNMISKISTIESLTVEGNGSSAYMVLKPGNAEGNAVIGVKVNGIIKWSWHIWITNYNPENEGLSIPSVNKMLMNRNLGALSSNQNDKLSKGLYYQWGRKDPFPSSAEYGDVAEPALFNEKGVVSVNKSLSPSTSADNLLNSIQNPNTFYIGSASKSFDWFLGTSYTSNNTLWSVQKSVYDPCPEGWRVPTNKEVAGFSPTEFTWSNNGYMIPFNTNALPQYGYRSYLNGNIIYPKINTNFFWTLTTDTEYSFSAGDNSLPLNPNSDYFKSYGLCIRCIKE